MTNEELTMLKDLITDDLISRKSAECFASKSREDKNKCDLLTKENERLMAECNRLRESEANALNAEREAVCDRDEMKCRLQDAEDCLNKLYWRYRINKGSPVLKFIREYAEKHGIEIVEGGMDI